MRPVSCRYAADFSFSKRDIPMKFKKIHISAFGVILALIALSSAAAEQLPWNSSAGQQPYATPNNKPIRLQPRTTYDTRSQTALPDAQTRSNGYGNRTTGSDYNNRYARPGDYGNGGYSNNAPRQRYGETNGQNGYNTQNGYTQNRQGQNYANRTPTQNDRSPGSRPPYAPREPYGRTYTDPGKPYAPPRQNSYQQPGDRYGPGPEYDERRRYQQQPVQPSFGDDGTYSQNEIAAAGHRFFGKVTTGLAKIIEHAFSRGGRPNGYILGEEAGGALIAGLRYGEGTLFTKNAGQQKVYWQGPSIGYDFGANGSKTMILVYNMRNTNDIYATYGGVSGSAYLVGGVGITYQKNGHVTLAPIRAGLGLRLGANLGYLKYTRKPTWNPF